MIRKCVLVAMEECHDMEKLERIRVSVDPDRVDETLQQYAEWRLVSVVNLPACYASSEKRELYFERNAIVESKPIACMDCGRPYPEFDKTKFRRG